jgi:3-oxoacyl-[acyl-carrier protein] reductase
MNASSLMGRNKVSDGTGGTELPKIIGPVALITGSASGLGRQLTQDFLTRGYTVIATDINSLGLQSAFKGHAGLGAGLLHLKTLDVSQVQAWEAIFTEVMQQFSRLDVMLNVAGYLKPGNLCDTPSEEVHRHMDINVKGVIFGSQLAGVQMRQQGFGHIINIASLAGLAAVPGIGLYSASKFAVRAFSLSLAQELKSSGVAVTVICPDAIQTPMLTLQEDYEEAALTFSGSKSLTVGEVSAALFDEALINKPMELILPRYRGWLAKVGNLIPQSSFFLGNILRKKGLQEQMRRKGLRH